MISRCVHPLLKMCLAECCWSQLAWPHQTEQRLASPSMRVSRSQSGSLLNAPPTGIIVVIWHSQLLWTLLCCSTGACSPGVLRLLVERGSLLSWYHSWYHNQYYIWYHYYDIIVMISYMISYLWLLYQIWQLSPTYDIIVHIQTMIS